MKKFDAVSFYNGFNITLKALAESERITKDALRSLSRECLMLVHYESNKQGDISPINQVLSVLTPVNKKAWIAFMQEFTGFIFGEAEQRFTKKDKQRYEEKFLLACEFLDDPANDIWSWAKTHLDVKVKPSPLESLGKAVDKALNAKNKETGKNLYTKADILRTVLENGIDADDLIAMLQAMDVVEVN